MVLSEGHRLSRRTGFFEAILWTTGALGFAISLMTGAKMISAKRAASTIAADHPSSDSPVSENSDGSYSPAAAVKSNPRVVGRVEIPALGLTTPLLAGDDSMSLTQGAGHIPGTAMPGGLGTVGIAGHRDTHFRLLNKVEPGMDIRLIDHTGMYHYRVTSSEIVTPEQVSVLNIQSTPGLVLVTCYPFHYIGSAPKRFIVHAALLSVAPDAH